MIKQKWGKWVGKVKEKLMIVKMRKKSQRKIVNPQEANINPQNMMIFQETADLIVDHLIEKEVDLQIIAEEEDILQDISIANRTEEVVNLLEEKMVIIDMISILLLLDMINTQNIIGEVIEIDLYPREKIGTDHELQEEAEIDLLDKTEVDLQEIL